MSTTTRHTGSALITREMAQRAVELALPILDASTRDERINQSGFLYVVITDPTRTPMNASFDEAILYEQAIGGPREKWDADYAAFARAKTRVSWEHGRDSFRVQMDEPYRLRSGDTTLWGSVCLDGIVVGVSGGEAAFDEAFAGTVAMLLRALAKMAYKERSAKELFYA
ncbi:hypothetical protein [Caldimonas brevitalea]|uniref:Uncharacterized protein n=1 Tax=Caldimonas brevitalea TaxID=413882 RepID=A0A0G3BF91_9BURK|nr:hypothetical protein [Caldimonas brevitalea]AKJ27982.1 hypothetical protein AAW51_1291 [Caldimonas brevitalea]